MARRPRLSAVCGVGLVLLLPGILCAEEPEASKPALLTWREWGDHLFAKAKAEDRFILLDLEAVWCHWCHVMEDTTYRDPEVGRLVQAKYLPARADQDASPDLSLRYEDWGWPATVIFAPDGTEIVKRRGYLPPPLMASLLQAIIDDPSPGPSVLPDIPVVPAGVALLSEAHRTRLLQEHDELYDEEHGGWGFQLKLIDADSLEYAMERALEGDAREAARARRTLEEALQLHHYTGGAGDPGVVPSDRMVGCRGGAAPS